MGISASFPAVLPCLCLCSRSWAGPGSQTCVLRACGAYWQRGIKPILGLFPYG